LAHRIISRPDQSVWPAFGALMFFFVINNYTETVAFKHSDISWAIVIIVAFYAGSQRQRFARPAKLALKTVHSRNIVFRPIRIGHSAALQQNPGSSG
jgi:hypothetical protein